MLFNNDKSIYGLYERNVGFDKERKIILCPNLIVLHEYIERKNETLVLLY